MSFKFHIDRRERDSAAGQEEKSKSKNHVADFDLIGREGRREQSDGGFLISFVPTH